MIDFYEKNDIHIHNTEDGIRKFVEFKAGEFPHCRSGELRMEHCAVLGKFPICSSSIQKDFDEILARNEINALLNDLLLNADEIDYYSDSYAGDMPITVNNRELEISEHNIVYINDLNSSQEAVLSAIESLDELVVQGPPGTGKSQTITSLISEFVSNGKTVLMVSEKKTALDVVYSRLGNLSQYALLIDDVGNKDAFYQQLLKMVSLGRWTGKETIDLANISDGIDSLVKRLEVIADKLYAPSGFGIEPYKMYIKNKRVDLSDSNHRERIRQINQCRDESLLTLTYSELDNMHHIFSDATTAEKIARYYEISNLYPWLGHVRGTISEYETIDFEGKLDSVAQTIKTWKSKNFLVKLFTKGKVQQKITAILSEYFSNSGNEMYDLFFNDVDSVVSGAKYYIDYQELKPLYDRLIDDLIDAESAKNPRFAAEIRTELARRKDGEDIGLFVKNIESVQGDERDVIIFSIGYAKNENGRLIRNFGWLNQRGGENRLNVAISRAKKKVHIVTSFNPAELQVEDMKNDGPRILKKYLEYAFAVSAGDRDTAKQILLSFGDDANPGQTVSFDSDFENQVYDALVEKGYQVDTQIGIGGYSIDLAIKKDGKYILGIECDGRLYHSSKSARERDYHRQKYLESRGWRIHRIWSTNWWKNPQREISKICNVVNSLS